MNYVKEAVLCVLVCLAGCNRATSQTTPQPSGEAKTKLEALEARTGVVIIRGFAKIGSVSDEHGGKVSVEGRESLDASTGMRELGIAIEVANEGDTKKNNTSYIDYDEVDLLLKGIDYIYKAQGSATKLEDFRADYRTKGDFEISTFSRRTGSIMAGVSSGSIEPVSAHFPLSKLNDLRVLIAEAKARLDAIK